MELQTITNVQNIDESNFIGTTLQGAIYNWNFDILHNSEISNEIKQIKPTIIYNLPNGNKIYKMKILSENSFLMYFKNGIFI